MFWGLLVVSLFMNDCSSERAPIFYRNAKVCGVQSALDKGCAKELPYGELTALDCARHCRQQDSCIGASFNKANRKCVIHEFCPLNAKSCVNGSSDMNIYRHFSSYCGLGHWNDVTGDCECPVGCYGVRCEKTFRICEDLHQFGFPSRIFRVYIDPLQDGNIMHVVCSIVSTSWSALWIFSHSGNTNYNRTWTEYVHGFVPSTGEFFSGLEAWHILSSQFQYTGLRLKMKFGSSEFIRSYANFVVRPGSEDYTFTFTSSGAEKAGPLTANYSFEECLNGVKDDVPFTTWDRNGGECAFEAGSGWWRNPSSCDQSCNFLGRWNDDWEAIPLPQRVAVDGVDMEELGVLPTTIRGYAVRIT